MQTSLSEYNDLATMWSSLLVSASKEWPSASPGVCVKVVGGCDDAGCEGQGWGGVLDSNSYGSEGGWSCRWC